MEEPDGPNTDRYAYATTAIIIALILILAIYLT